jgi:hypothetical protein
MSTKDMLMQPTVDASAPPPRARMQLAMYRGPGKAWAHKLLHWAICLFTWSRYSHIELVIDGICYSASNRDGGVRGKRIDLTSGNWDVFDLPDTFQVRRKHALAWFKKHDGENYDWLGIARLFFLLRWLPVRKKHHFCSKAVAAALQVPDPEDFPPDNLLEHLTA